MKQTELLDAKKPGRVPAECLAEPRKAANAWLGFEL